MPSRMTLTLADETKTGLKEKAEQAGTTMRAIIEDAILSYLDPDKITISLPADLQPAWDDYLEDFPGTTLEHAYDCAIRGDFLAKGLPKGIAEDSHILVRNIPVPAQCIDAKGTIKEVSPQWLVALGYNRRQVVNQPLGDFLTEDSKVRMKANIKKTIDNRPDSFERQYIHADGTIKTAKVWLHRELNLGKLETSTSIVIFKD